AYEQNRTLGLLDGADHLVDLIAVRVDRRMITAKVNFLHGLEQRLRRGDILRNVDQNRSLAARVRDMERFMDDARQLLNVANHVAMLRNRHRDAYDISFLEGIRADQR